jgi:hypothetical protein
MMEFLLLCLAIGAAYKFYKANKIKFMQLSITVGAESLRAYIYLEALLKGVSKHEAQALTANSMMMDLDPSVMMQIMTEIQLVHNNKPAALVAEAYSRGMPSNLPKWYQYLVKSRPPTLSVAAIYSIPLTQMEEFSLDKASQTTRNSHTQYQTPDDERRVIRGHNINTFDEYHKIVISELRYLSGKRPDQIHPIEIMEDDPLRRAFFDGMDPRILARMMHKHLFSPRS